jgi:hypothetical protein
VPMNNMQGYKATLAEMVKTIEYAKQYPSLNEFSSQLSQALDTLSVTTQAVLSAMSTKNIDLALANSVKYLELFGHVIIAWLWLKQSIVATKAIAEQPHQADMHFYQGKLQACQYFYRFELPEISVWSNLLINTDSTSFDMQPDWF